MTITRARLDIMSDDGAGNVWQNASVYVLKFGTAAALDPPTGTAVNVYSAYDAGSTLQTGGGAVTRIGVTDNTGQLACWVDAPGPYDVVVTDNAHTVYYPATPSSTKTFSPILRTEHGQAEDPGRFIDTTTLRHKIYFDFSYTNGDTQDLSSRGREDTPYKTLTQFVTDSAYWGFTYNSGTNTITNFNYALHFKGNPTDVSNPRLYPIPGTNKPLTFQGCQITITGEKYNSAAQQETGRGPALITGSVAGDAVLHIKGCNNHDIHDIGIQNTAADGDGLHVEGASIPCGTIERVDVLGPYAPNPPYPWTASDSTLGGMVASITTGVMVCPTKTNANNHVYRYQSGSGNTGATEPAWPLGSGATIVDGAITWVEVGALESGKGIRLRGDGIDGLTVRNCMVTCTGEGYTTEDDGNHAPNRLKFEENRHENVRNYGLHFKTTKVPTSSTGGHLIEVNGHGFQGNLYGSIGLFVEGQAGVHINGNGYWEVSGQKDTPDVLVRCINGGTASTEAHWTFDFSMSGFYMHGVANVAQIATWTAASKYAQYIDIDSAFGVRIVDGHNQGGNVSAGAQNLIQSIGYDADTAPADGLPNFPIGRFGTNTKNCIAEITNVYANDDRSLANRPPHREMIWQDGNGWAYNGLVWFEPKSLTTKGVGNFAGRSQPSQRVQWVYTVPTALTAAQGGAGAIPAATYQYRVVYVYEGGKTAQGANTSFALGVSSKTISLTNIPTSADSRVYARWIYRTIGGGATYKFLTAILDNTTTTYTDNTIDANLGANIAANGVLDALAMRTSYWNVTDATAFTVPNPTSPVVGQQLQVHINNTSGGAMGAITWDTQFLLGGAFVNPATGKSRKIAFTWDGTNWGEDYRTGADF